MSQKVLNSIFEMFPACTAMSMSRGELEDQVSLLNRKARTTVNTNRYSILAPGSMQREASRKN